MGAWCGTWKTGLCFCYEGINDVRCLTSQEILNERLLQAESWLVYFEGHMTEQFSERSARRQHSDTAWHNVWSEIMRLILFKKLVDTGEAMFGEFIEGGRQKHCILATNVRRGGEAQKAQSVTLSLPFVTVTMTLEIRLLMIEALMIYHRVWLVIVISICSVIELFISVDNRGPESDPV